MSRPLFALAVGLLLPASAGARMDGNYGGHTTTCGTVSFHHHAGRISSITTGPYGGIFRPTRVDDRGAFSATSEEFGGVFHGKWVSQDVVEGHYYYRPPRDNNYPRWRAYLHVAPVPGHYTGSRVSFSVASGHVVNFHAANGGVSIDSVPLHRNGFATLQDRQAACGSWSGTEEVGGFYRAGSEYGNHPVAYDAHWVSD